MRDRRGRDIAMIFQDHEASDDGKGLAPSAFRTGRSFVSNDYLNDERTRRWHAHARKIGARSAAAVPIKRHGNPIGESPFYLDQPHALTEETVGLLERMAENVSFALDNFDRDRATTRIHRMFAALTATNEAILRAHGDEMFQLVCEAASDHGNLLGAAIFTPEPDSSWFMLAAQAGRLSRDHRQPALPRRSDDPAGTGLGRHRIPHRQTLHQQRRRQ